MLIPLYQKLFEYINANEFKSITQTFYLKIDVLVCKLILMQIFGLDSQ